MCSSDMKTKKTLTRLYLRAFLLALPFLILATIYVVNDPFMVIKNYADYDHPAVGINIRNIEIVFTTIRLYWVRLAPCRLKAPIGKNISKQMCFASLVTVKD